MTKTIDRPAVLATFEATKQWRPDGNVAETARAHGICVQTATKIIAGVPLKRRGRQPGTTKESGRNSRFKSKHVTDRVARLPAIDSPFLVTKNTRYPHSVVRAEDLSGWALKDGFHAQKIGRTVMKGAWAAMRIWTLTLEERATCPTSCKHWRSCFGNKMNWAERIMPGPALELRLWNEVHELGRQYPDGFVVRLHVLGDFYSPEYVAMWAVLLDRVPALRVFGYTARIDGKNDPIAAALINLVSRQWDRFAVRFSDAPIDEISTISLEHPIQAPPGAIICPEQLGKAASCAECTLCWSTKRPIAFLQH